MLRPVFSARDAGLPRSLCNQPPRFQFSRLYRSFSYQPAAEPTYRAYTGRKLNAWDYPKTDARRYNGGNN
jgi:hypothetical protein